MVLQGRLYTRVYALFGRIKYAGMRSVGLLKSRFAALINAEPKIAFFNLSVSLHLFL